MIDLQLLHTINEIKRKGVKTEGRTPQSRIRLFEGMNLSYRPTELTFEVMTLRKNNPAIAFAETYAFLAGAKTVDDLVDVHPALKLWSAWADDNGDLGGVYGDAFSGQYIDVVDRLINDPLSTHIRMTTLIPDKFPIPGNTYHENVKAGRFSLMPCLHSFHFLSDGETLHLHATQASGDLAIGVIPHNAYQCQFLLMLTAKLTELKVGKVHHKVHDIHYYENQTEMMDELLNRNTLDLSERNHNTNYEFLDGCGAITLRPIEDIIHIEPFETLSALDIPVDS